MMLLVVALAACGVETVNNQPTEMQEEALQAPNDPTVIAHPNSCRTCCTSQCSKSSCQNGCYNQYVLCLYYSSYEVCINAYNSCIASCNSCCNP